MHRFLDTDHFDFALSGGFRADRPGPAWSRDEFPGANGRRAEGKDWGQLPDRVPAAVIEKVAAKWSDRLEDDPGGSLGTANYDLVVGYAVYGGLGGNSGESYFFNPELSLTGGSGSPTQIVLGDFDRDSNLDVAGLTNNGAPNTGFTVNIAPSQDDFRSGNTETAFSTSSGQYTSSIAGLFNPDDLVDIILAGTGVNAVILTNSYSAEAGFSFELIETDVNLGVAPVMHAGDLDLDGDLDIVSVDLGNPVQILWNDGGDTPSFTVTTLPGAPYASALGDFDGNGTLDIVSGGAGNSVKIAYNQGDTDDDGTVNFDIDEINGSITAEDFEVADFDGNGLQDILMIENSKSLYLFLQQKDGSMALEEIPTAGPFQTPGEQLAAADVDADGDIDFVQWRAANLYYYENTGLDEEGVPDFVLAEEIEIANYFAPGGGVPVLEMHFGGYYDADAVTEAGLPYLGDGLPYTESFDFMG